MESLNLKFGREAERRIRTLVEKDNLSKRNTELILQFVRDAMIKGFALGPVGEARVVKYFGQLKNLAIWFGKDFDTVTKEDVERVVGFLKTSKYAESSRWSYRVLIKMFWKWLEGNNELYPDKVRWIRAKQEPGKVIVPEDMITRQDLNNMLKVCRNERDKCIAALLYESGMRLGELLSLKVKNVDLQSDPVKVFIDAKKTKTKRNVPIVESVPYIVKWLQAHPDPRPDSPLFVDMHKAGDRTIQIRKEAIYMMLSRIGKKMSSQKKIYPHLFRHSRASELANYLTEAQMCKFFGWAMGSDMPAVYVHLSGRDIDNAILGVYGLATRNKNLPDKLIPKTCPRCKAENLATDKLCGNCGLPLDLASQIERNKKEEVSVFVLKKVWETNPQLKSMVQEVTKKFNKEIEKIMND